jgi:hypothetical protein
VAKKKKEPAVKTDRHMTRLDRKERDHFTAVAARRGLARGKDTGLGQLTRLALHSFAPVPGCECQACTVSRAFIAKMERS